MKIDNLIMIITGILIVVIAIFGLSYELKYYHLKGKLLDDNVIDAKCELKLENNIKKICYAKITRDGNIYLDNCEYHN